MIGIVLALYGELASHYTRKWEKEMDIRKWETWDRYEEMRDEMGVSAGTEKIPKRKRRPPRRKHHA